jgi:cytochrome c oxidase subunit II
MRIAARLCFLLPLMAHSAFGADDGFWFPRAASDSARTVDGLFQFVLWVSIFFFVLVIGLMSYLVIRYRKRAGVEPQPTADHNMPLELLWTSIPFVLVMVMFYLGFQAYLDQRTPPQNAYEIQVRGKQWFWTFIYPNDYESAPEGDQLPELHVPKGEDVRLVLTSVDVIHGLFIPVFRLKMDVVPGRFNRTWFCATEEGTFPIYCSSYCGTQHSGMRATCVVHPDRASFDAWLTSAKDRVGAKMPPAERGHRIYAGKGGCVQCHTLDGRTSTGPSFKELWGSTQTLADGSKVLVDEEYVRQHILTPGITVVKGFRNEMPAFKGLLRDSEIMDLIEFLKSQSQHYKPPEKKIEPGIQGAQPVPAPTPDAKKNEEAPRARE